MMIESSSYNGMVMATLVADIWAIKNPFFVKMLFLLTKMLPNVVILKEKRVFYGLYVGHKCWHGHTIIGR